MRAYDANDQLIAAYPATIGSETNPSPSGTHTVEAIAPDPNYHSTGSNNPVGSMWIT